MEHIGVSQQQSGLGTNGVPLPGWRVAIIDRGGNFGDNCCHRIVWNLVRYCLNFFKLVLSQRLGWKDIERPSDRIFDQGIQNGEVVTKSFTTRSSSYYYQVFPGLQVAPGVSLVRIKFIIPGFPQAILQGWVQLPWKA